MATHTDRDSSSLLRLIQTQHSFRAESGQDIVEYALIFPMLMLITFTIVEAGLLFLDYSTIANAAREGARAAIVPPNDSCDAACIDAGALSAAQQLTTGLDPGQLSVIIQRPSVSSVRVQVDYNANLITGPVIAALGGQNTIALKTVATMQRE